MVYFFSLEKDFFFTKETCSFPSGLPSSRPFWCMGRKSRKKKSNNNHRRNCLNWASSPNYLQIQPKWHLNVQIFFLFMSPLPCPLLVEPGQHTTGECSAEGLTGCSFSSFEVEIWFSVKLYQSYLQDLFHLSFEKEIFWGFPSLLPVPVWSVPHKCIWKQPLIRAV